MNEDYEDYDEDDGDDDGMVLCFGEDGPEVKMASELEEIENNKMEIITEFIKENVESFKKFLDKKGLTEDDFNKGIKEKEKGQ